jgi:aminoglycoside phosphotransferase (APT) family kinase protein
MPDPVALARLIERVAGAPMTIGAVHRYSGGASRETWGIDATDAAGAPHGFVLRRDPSGEPSSTGKGTEYALLAAAEAGGVPVPRIRGRLEPDDGLGAGFVMDRVDGETIARRILRDDEYAIARPLLATQAGTIAARIHAVEPGTLPDIPVMHASAQLDQQRAYLDAFEEPHPALELGLRWLDERVPEPTTPPVLVHGDFRNGNFIVGPDGIRAVLDWELAHLGDPLEDLGWLCVKSWRFGNATDVAGGFGSLDRLLAAYNEASGRSVSEDAIRFWVVLGTVKWGVICVGRGFGHAHGLVRSVEMAALGRRVAEMEWDLLDLLDGGW